MFKGLIASDLIRKERLKKCMPCEHYRFQICLKCGCSVYAKVTIKQQSCPIGKWLAVEETQKDLIDSNKESRD